MFREKRTFKNSRGLLLSAIFEGKDKKAPVVIICHGYASSKDSEAQLDLSEKLLKIGISVFRFDFTGCGDSQGSINDLTPNAGLDDLKSAVGNLGLKDFGLHGTSFGGYMVLRYASENRIKALTLKAPVSNWISTKSESLSLLKKIKFIIEVLPIDIYKNAQSIKCSVLITHGDADDVVPLEQSQNLLQALGSKNKKLEIIKGAPHRMRGKYMRQAHIHIVNFYKQALSN